MARRPDSTATLASITCPTLVIVGAAGCAPPPSDSKKMGAAVKGAKLVRIPGEAHLSNLDSPYAFNAALVELCDGAARVKDEPWPDQRDRSW